MNATEVMNRAEDERFGKFLAELSECNLYAEETPAERLEALLKCLQARGIGLSDLEALANGTSKAIHARSPESKYCPQCGETFVRGSGRRSGNKRAKAVYCSTRCRVAAWRARKNTALLNA